MGRTVIDPPRSAEPEIVEDTVVRSGTHPQSGLFEMRISPRNGSVAVNCTMSDRAARNLMYSILDHLRRESGGL